MKQLTFFEIGICFCAHTLGTLLACKNLDIVLLSTARMLTTFSNNQKKGLELSGCGLAYINRRKNSKNKRPLPSKGEESTTSINCQF